MSSAAPTPVLTVIQARMGSRRFPEKIVQPLCGRPMLAFLVERLGGAAHRGRLVLATTEQREDDRTAALGTELGLPVVRGPTEDLLTRFALCLEAYPAERLVRVTADNPFTDPRLFDALAVQSLDGTAELVHATGVPYGSAVDVFTRRAFQTSLAEARTAYQREHINAFILDTPQRFEIVDFAPDAALCRPDIRLTVDFPADLETLRRVAERLDDPLRAGLAEIIRVAAADP